MVSLKTAKRSPRHSIHNGTADRPNRTSVAALSAALAAAAGSGCLGVVLNQRVKLMCVGSSTPRPPKYWRLCHNTNLITHESPVYGVAVSLLAHTEEPHHVGEAKKKKENT